MEYQKSHVMSEKEEKYPIDYATTKEVPLGWDKMKLNFLTFFLTVILLGLLENPFEPAIDDLEEGMRKSVLQIFGMLYFFLVGPVIGYGADMIFVRGVREENPKIGELFDGFKKYKNIVLANLLVVALVALSLVFFIIPGIYVACRLAFVSYLVMDKDLGPQEAVEKSWQLTRNKADRIFFLGFGAVIIAVIGFLFLIVGLIPAIMWIKSYFAVFYEMALQEEEAKKEQAVPGGSI